MIVVGHNKMHLKLANNSGWDRYNIVGIVDILRMRHRDLRLGQFQVQPREQHYTHRRRPNYWRRLAETHWEVLGSALGLVVQVGSVLLTAGGHHFCALHRIGGQFQQDPPP